MIKCDDAHVSGGGELLVMAPTGNKLVREYIQSRGNTEQQRVADERAIPSSAPTGKLNGSKSATKRHTRLLFAHDLCANLWSEKMTTHADQAKHQKKPTNVSINQQLLIEAKALEVNVSRAAEAGLARAIADRRAELWLAENRAALESSNTYFEKHGLPLAKYRSF